MIAPEGSGRFVDKLLAVHVKDRKVIVVYAKNGKIVRYTFSMRKHPMHPTKGPGSKVGKAPPQSTPLEEKTK